MQAGERQLALEQLVASRHELFARLDGLTPLQWHFRESPDRWSIAGNLEHLILFEAFIRSAVQRTLAAAAEPQKKSQTADKESLVLNLANSRATKLNAREAVRPTGRYTDPTAMIAEFHNTRDETIAFAAQTQAPLRDHFFPHIAFGDLDCYQWLLVVGQHTLRHVRQIEQIKAGPAYPAGS